VLDEKKIEFYLQMVIIEQETFIVPLSSIERSRLERLKHQFVKITDIFDVGSICRIPMPRLFGPVEATELNLN
jgi:hypothetical protein